LTTPWFGKNVLGELRKMLNRKLDLEKLYRPQKTDHRDLNKRDAEITILRGTLAEIYYLLRDRSSKGIDNAMSHIEAVFPDLKKLRVHIIENK